MNMAAAAAAAGSTSTVTVATERLAVLLGMVTIERGSTETAVGGGAAAGADLGQTVVTAVAGGRLGETASCSINSSISSSSSSLTKMRERLLGELSSLQHSSGEIKKRFVV
jgi:hypothetical protein